MSIRGIDNLTLADIDREVSAGGRFVYYEYCLSVIVASSRRPSDIFFLRPGDWGILRGMPYSLLSFFFGWWGFYWGLIYTPLTLFNNLCGGCDVTEDVLTMLHAQPSQEIEPETETRSPPCDAS